MSRTHWGPYCPLPQEHPHYTHIIYPTARAVVRDGNTVREATDPELDALADQYRDALAQSCQEEWLG